MSAPVPPVAAPAPPAVPPVSAERRTSQYIDRLLARHGSAESALQAVSAEKFALEDTVASHERTIADLTGKVPKAGEMVLAKEAAASWTKLTALNLTPDQIVERVSKAAELEATVKRTDLEKLARSGAAQFGLDPDGLADHVVTRGLAAELRDATVTENGKSAVKKVLHVRPAGDANAPWKPAGEYVTGLAAHEQRALKATPMAPAVVGVPHPQTTVDLAPTDPKDLVAAAIKKQHEHAASRPNPLFPARKPAGATA